MKKYFRFKEENWVWFLWNKIMKSTCFIFPIINIFKYCKLDKRSFYLSIFQFDFYPEYIWHLTRTTKVRRKVNSKDSGSALDLFHSLLLRINPELHSLRKLKQRSWFAKLYIQQTELTSRLMKFLSCKNSILRVQMT